MLYCLYTLVDITATGHYRSGNILEKNQQQNFETICQTIQLSGNMYFENKPTKLPATIFGLPEQFCWYFEWRMEIDDLFLKDKDHIAKLKEMFEFVPFIAGCTEQVKFDRAYFVLGHNIIFDFKH